MCFSGFCFFVVALISVCMNGKVYRVCVCMCFLFLNSALFGFACLFFLFASFLKRESKRKNMDLGRGGGEGENMIRIYDMKYFFQKKKFLLQGQTVIFLSHILECNE